MQIDNHIFIFMPDKIKLMPLGQVNADLFAHFTATGLHWRFMLLYLTTRKFVLIALMLFGLAPADQNLGLMQ